MPIIKPAKLKQPLWKEWDEAAKKKGQHHTVYSVNGDHYTGEWLNNKKNGKGTHFTKRTGGVYDGDWKDDLRSGFGMYSLPGKDGGFRKVYAGGWKHDKKHVTLNTWRENINRDKLGFISSRETVHHSVVGHGTFYYSEKIYYEGEWYQGKRSGWGRMYYGDGSVYEGEWFDDYRNGSGMLRLADENRYEGEWKDDKKHGNGKYYHLDKGQVFIGTWVDDIAKCGVMEDFNRDTAANATKYPIPELKLTDPVKVLEDATNDIENMY